MITKIQSKSLGFLLLLNIYENNLIECTKFNKTYTCGHSVFRKPRVVSGEDAFVGEFPWMASILVNEINSLTHYCGGILINDQWILSAAHCVVDYTPNKFIVRLGAHSIQTKLEKNAIDIPVESIIIHQNYSRPRAFANDIALLKLKTKVQYTDYIIPICLPEADDPNIADMKSALVSKYDTIIPDVEKIKGTVVGWGWLKESDRNQEKILGNILQKVKLPIISNIECEIWYRTRGKLLPVSPTQFCAGFMEGGKDACRGDSGGPLLLRNITTNMYYLIGIVSAGIGCAQPRLPGLYTRVDSYIHWINKYLNQ